MKKRVKWAFALIGLLMSLTACDKGEEMEKGSTVPFDAVGMLILDKDSNNVMDPNINKYNPNVVYDPDMRVIFQGDTLTERGWSHKPDYFNGYPTWGNAWRLKFNCINPGRYGYILVIGAVMMYDSQTYEFDVESPRNNYKWHIRLEYETHSTAQYRDFHIRSCWVDGKRMSNRRICVYNGYVDPDFDNPFKDPILQMNK